MFRPGLLPAATKLVRGLLLRRGFREHHVATRSGRVHVFDAEGAGTLPPVVLLHGLGSGSTAFARLLLRLLPHVSRVVAPDLVGHGFSDPPTETLLPQTLFDAMTEALDAIDLPPFFLVGHSLGGAVAGQYALRRPERLRGLALLSPAGADVPMEEMDKVTASFRATTAREARQLLAKLTYRATWFTPLIAPDFVELCRGAAVRDLVETVTERDAFPKGALATLTMPVLLYWGAEEKLLPKSALEYFKAELPPGSQLLEPPRVGHCPHLDDLEGLTASLLAFFERRELGPPRDSVRAPSAAE